MEPSRLRATRLLACLGLLSCVPVHASVAVDPSLLAADYSQDFDTLGFSSSFNWVNDTTLTGWYAVTAGGNLNANVQISSGSSNASALTLYSLGNSGSTERALSYHTISADMPTYLGLAFSNQTGGEIAGFTVGYTGEQWRENTDNRTLTYTVEYRIGATADELDDAAGWTEIAGLAVDTSGGSGGAATPMTSGLVLDAIPAGSSFWLRWKLANDADSTTNSNDILAIDDITVDFEAPADLAPSIDAQPLPQLVAVGDTASFTVEVSGTPEPGLQWFLDGSPVSGATSATLVLDNVQLSQAGNYTVTATNSEGSATSAPALLTVSTTPLPPQILAQPEGGSDILGGSVTLEVTATGSGTLGYQWFRDSVLIPGAEMNVLSLDPLQAGDLGSYTVTVSNVAGEETSTPVLVEVTLPPSFSTQPTAQAVAEGGEATFEAVATGEGDIGYQWFKNGSPLEEESGASLTLSAVSGADEGSYRVDATNLAGTTASNSVALTVLQAPAITTQPAGNHLVVGGSHSFTVGATGSAPLEYQWTKDGGDLSGETAATLTIDSAALADAGDYAVRVSNSVGSATSSAAQLQVSATAVAPAITTDLASFSAPAETAANFTVGVSGTAPFSYAWTRDGAPIAASGPVLMLDPLSEADAGDYQVTVSNAAGSATSAIATLTVTASTQRDYYVAPDGQPDAAGTLADPTTLPVAITLVEPGFRIYMRGGTYSFSAQITIARDNTGLDEAHRKGIFAYTTPEGVLEEPLLDFSSQPYGKTSQVSNPRGIKIDGHWWHLYGLRIYRAADNGIFVGGNHNIIERCTTFANRDTGVQISRYSSDADDKAEWPAHNLVLNCDSYDNHDHDPNQGENADGFAAKLTSGPGNVFRGCVGHNNIDDGWDLFTKSDTGTIFPVVIDQCVAYGNGTLSDGTTNSSGDRNGFKLGGSGIAVVHYVTRSIAFDNGKNGFTWNSNPAAMLIANNLAFDNERGNFKFDDPAPIFLNNVSLYTSGEGENDRYGGNSGIATGPSNLFWFTGSSSRGPSINDQGLEVSAASFRSLVRPSGGFARRADGSLDLGDFGRPVEGSPLVNAGSMPPVGIWDELVYDVEAYHEDEPDIGVVETYLVSPPVDGDELLGYALGYRDAAETQIDLPVLGFAGGDPVLSFKRLRAELVYQVEASDNLVDWAVLATDPGVVGGPVQVVDTGGAGGPRRFLRLRVLAEP